MRPPSSTCRCSASGCGRWARPWRSRSSSTCRGRRRPPGRRPATRSCRAYRDQGRPVHLVLLPAGRPATGPTPAAVIDRPELADDQRFADASQPQRERTRGGRTAHEAIATRTAAEWRDRLADFTGQWTVVQDTLEAAADPQTLANGYIADCQTAEGVPFQLAAAPVQYDEEPAQPQRAPEFNEHGDEILADIGLDMDAIVDLKVRGVVA